MPTRNQLFQLWGSEEHLWAWRGIIPPSHNTHTDFTGEVIGILKRDEKSWDLKLEITPDPNDWDLSWELKD